MHGVTEHSHALPLVGISRMMPQLDDSISFAKPCFAKQIFSNLIYLHYCYYCLCLALAMMHCYDTRDTFSQNVQIYTFSPWNFCYFFMYMHLFALVCSHLSHVKGNQFISKYELYQQCHKKFQKIWDNVVLLQYVTENQFIQRDHFFFYCSSLKIILFRGKVGTVHFKGFKNY